jgi:alkaline phosphatase
MGGYSTRGNPILGKVISNGRSGKPEPAYDLMNDNKPFTSLAYQSGPGGNWIGRARPDLSEIDTSNDKNFIQQAGLPADDETHGGEDVAVYARGPGAEGIHGVMEQNEIFHVIDAATHLVVRAAE